VTMFLLLERPDRFQRCARAGDYFPQRNRRSPDRKRPGRWTESSQTNLTEETLKCGVAIVVTLDNVRRAKVSIFSGCNSHPATVVPAGSNRDDRGGNEPVEALDGKGRFGRLREWAGRNMRERRAGLEKRLTVGADPTLSRGRPPSWT
jgi:hypothetical protein